MNWITNRVDNLGDVIPSAIRWGEKVIIIIAFIVLVTLTTLILFL